MNEYLLPIEILIDQFRKLPGVGRKTAARYAMAVLDMTDESARAFSESIAAAKKDIHRCPVCNNFTDGELCPVCLDENRLPVICVVEDVRALLNIEKVRDYRGRYHVLGGVLSPIKGIGPEKLGIDRLTKRIASEGITEVIVATNPTVEGDATAIYIMRALSPSGVKVTRLALGIPVGADIEYADELTLARAIKSRGIME